MFSTWPRDSRERELRGAAQTEHGQLAIALEMRHDERGGTACARWPIGPRYVQRRAGTCNAAIGVAILEVRGDRRKHAPHRRLRVGPHALSSRRSRVRVPSLPPSFVARWTPTAVRIRAHVARWARPVRAPRFAQGSARKRGDVAGHHPCGDQGGGSRAMPSTPVEWAMGARR